MDDRLSEAQVRNVFEESKLMLTEALAVDAGARSWRTVFPGKRILTEFAKRQRISDLAFQNSLLMYLSSHRDKIPKDLMGLVSAVAEGKRL